jgi:hypothetical protein
MAALRAAWTAWTLKRAIADVATTSDQDYRAFGLDKGEILQGLRQLRDEIERSGLAAAPGSAQRLLADTGRLETGRRWPLAILLVSMRATPRAEAARL